MRISDWSSDVCSSDLAQSDAQRHGGEDPDRQVAIEKAQALRLGEVLHQITFRPASSMTRSPSSLAKAPRCGAGRISRTASEGRQSFTPSGETTSGRLMRIGNSIIASRSEEHRTELKSLMSIKYAF